MIFGLPPFLDLTLISAGMTFITSLFYKFLLDQNALREIKAKVKEKQEKLNEVQKTNPKEANQILNEMLILNNRQFSLMRKPLFVTLIFVIIALNFVRGLFSGDIVLLPFSLPFLGDSLDWIAWYAITAIPFSQIFRMLIGVEI